MTHDFPKSADEFRIFLGEASDIDVERIHYCYQIGSTFVTLSLMEDSIVSSISMCDEIKIQKLIEPNDKAWEFIKKRDYLQSSTLGGLISILSKQSIATEDMNYLRWLRDKRNFFIHRFFHKGAWPGELGHQGLKAECRKLLYLELLFQRGCSRIWSILSRSGLFERIDLGADGALVMPINLHEKVQGEE